MKSYSSESVTPAQIKATSDALSFIDEAQQEEIDQLDDRVHRVETCALVFGLVAFFQTVALAWIFLH